MGMTIEMAVDAVCVGGPSFEKFSRLLGVSHGDHFGRVPIEVVVTVYGVRKDEGQGVGSVDGQFIFVYVGPKLHMEYVADWWTESQAAITPSQCGLYGTPTPWDPSQVWWYTQRRLQPRLPPAPSLYSGHLDSVMTPGSSGGGGESVVDAAQF
ncbi:unnamed protein product [Schistocephalus solidus]|uniref:Peptidylprolyl isomerase n=1 Tax=Schistocephalus solidus TaxID=70667 RepID=A0A183SJX6_SCHSO|nr:unnamed protein product [Schistocephalus solidus]